jgi:cytochrome c biogenesis protein CcmG/thiol:disulfide interchange protein DsbE
MISEGITPNMRTTVSVLALTLILAIIPAASALAEGEVGQPAPPLVAQELNGQEFNLASEHGKVVIVNFWATWCPPCRKEMPTLDAFYKRYHSEGLEMIGMSADSHHDRSDVASVAQTISYPAAMLNDATPNGFGDPDELPETWVIDRNGIVRAELTPDKTEVTEKSLADVVLPLLASKVPATKSSPAVAQ